MLSTFYFDCLKLKMRFCGMPFPKSIVYSDVVVGKLLQRYKVFFPGINAGRYTLKVGDGQSP